MLVLKALLDCVFRAKGFLSLCKVVNIVEKSVDGNLRRTFKRFKEYVVLFKLGILCVHERILIICQNFFTVCPVIVIALRFLSDVILSL